MPLPVKGLVGIDRKDSHGVSDFPGCDRDSGADRGRRLGFQPP